MVTPIHMLAGGLGAFGMVAFTGLLSFALISLVFFGLKYLHKKRHPTEEDVKETNRRRREREKIKRETTQKVNDYMSGKGKKEESAPNGKRSGKYKKKNKKK